MTSIRTLLLELVDEQGASHIRELHIEILRDKPGTPEHTIRARLSEAVADGLLDRLGDGFYDVYAEDEDMTSVVSYPNRCSLWGDSRYRGNCDGRLFKNLVLRYHARKVADPMAGSGTTRDVIEGIIPIHPFIVIASGRAKCSTWPQFSQMSIRASRPNPSMSKAWSHVPVSRYFFFLNSIPPQMGHLTVVLPILA